MSQSESVEPIRREVSWGGKLLGLGIVGTVVILVMSAERTGNTAITANAAPILGLALAAAIAIPMLLCRRAVRD